MVRETGLDSRGSSPLGQRRSQAPLGLDSLRLLQVRFPSLQKEARRFAELSFVVRETGLDSHGSPPLGQRRSQATLWPDSPAFSPFRVQKKPDALPSFLCEVRKQDWILTARRRSVSAPLSGHTVAVILRLLQVLFLP
ncbi:MAG: hypothetical protein ACLR4A_12295 [Christensenellales bacterium]